MSGAILRPGQVALLDQIDAAIAAGDRHLVAQAPTGFGKTIVAAAIARRNLGDGRRTLFIAPALSLIDQTVEKFYAEGIREVGVIQADHDLTNWTQPVQVASVQTLMRRKSMPLADMVLIDEVHVWFKPYEKWLAGAWSHIPVIGLSATPGRKGLGKHFGRLIVGATTRDLIDAGHLSKFRVFGPAAPDLTGVRTLAGDYHEGDLGDAMDKESLVADIVDTWIDRGENRPTICFAVNRVHAKHLQTKFIAAGVPAGYIDSYTEVDERDEIKRQFHAGEIKIVVNVGCLTTGIDWDIRCIILARPTKSEMLFVQMVGRGLRTAPGKADCQILDHSDNHTRIGFVTDVGWDKLDDGEPKPKAEPKSAEKLPKPCPKCTFMIPPKTLACPACGFIPVPQCLITPRDGELVELKSRSSAAAIDPTFFYRELKHYAIQRGYKPGWISHKYKEKFGNWPNGLDHLSPVDPSRTTLGWIKSRQISFAKGRRA